MAKSLAVWISNSNDKPLNAPKNGEPEQAETASSNKEQDVKNKGCDRPEIELHINYWVLNDKNLNRKKSPAKENTWIEPIKSFVKFYYTLLDAFNWLISFAKERETTTYLDVGVKFSKTKKDDVINIFFPFNVKPHDYDSQLGLEVANDVLLLSTIFNSEVSSVEFKDNFYHHSDISFLKAGKNKNDRVRFYTNIDLQEDENNPLGSGVRLHDVKGEGSILSFPMKNFRLDDGIDGYLRFRLILDPISKKALSTYYVPSDSFMLTTEESMEIIDFRVNEIRNTPVNVNSLQTFRSVLTKVHFFIIREVKSEYVMSDKSYHRSRLLEGDLWKKYLQSHHIKPITDVPKMLIFHWKSEDSSKPLENFSAFAKFRHTRRSLWIILRSIAIGLVLSIAANWLYDLF